MFKSVETYANIEPILLADIRKVSKDLEQAKFESSSLCSRD